MTAVQMVPVVVLSRLKYPLGNPLLRANTENMFAFDMWQNPIWVQKLTQQGSSILHAISPVSSSLSFLVTTHTAMALPREVPRALLCYRKHRSETLAGNVNLDQASKTQQNNWWSCQAQPFIGQNHRLVQAPLFIKSILIYKLFFLNYGSPTFKKCNESLFRKSNLSVSRIGKASSLFSYRPQQSKVLFGLLTASESQ